MSRQEAMRSADVPVAEQMKIAADQDQKERTSIVELQERITRDLMDPHTQNLLKELLKQSKKTVEEKESPRKDASPDPATVASELEELGMDLEEVGEEVDDIFGKSISRSVEDSIGNSFQEGLECGKRLRQVQASTNPSPPSRERGHEPRPSSRGPDTRYPSDWNVKSTVEDPRKHLHSSLQSSEEPNAKDIPDDAKSSGSSFWVPAFDWHKAQKVKKDMSYQSGANDWEVETPYVQRKEKMGERQAGHHPTLKDTKQMVPPSAISSSSSSSSRVPPVPAMTSQLDEEATASRITEMNKDKAPQSRPMLFPSGHSYSPSVPPPSSQTRAHSSRSALPSPGDEAADDHEPPVQVRSKSKRQKTGKSKQRRSYDSGSDSSAEDKKTSKMHEREVKELEDPVQKLMQKRDTLLKRARSLTEQKDLMMNQRDDIISNHKGDKSSLNNLLQENWFLMKEMGNQITKINHMVIEVEKEIEVLKPGNQPLPRAESPQRRSSRSPAAMRFCGPSRQYEHGKTPERNYKHVEASYRNESKGYEYPEHRRSISPASGKHRSRSPAAAGPHRMSSPAPRQQRSRSPNVSRHKSRSPNVSRHKSRSPNLSRHKSRSPNVSRHKSRSPNAGRHRTRSPVSGSQQQRLWSPSGEYSKEFQRAPSTSRKRTTASKSDGEKRQQDVYRKKEEPKEEIDEGLQYPQGFVQRTYIRYCDQGMHWCKLCSIFCESIPEYVDHLISSSHLAKCKYDRKTWLAKAPKEEKEPKPPNATALIVPVQGVEFLHSLTSYYCSLCDVFMRDKGEAVRHPESKIHTSNYKMHLVKNPMYEASLVKTKAAAYAKYSVEQARYMVEAKMKLKEKIATDEIEEKLLRQIKQKRDMVRQEKEEGIEINEKVERERSQRQESKKEKSEKRERERVVESDSGKTHDHKNESSVTQTQASESKEYKDTSTRRESKKEKGSSREVVTKDVKTDGDEAAYADGSYKDSQDDEKKSAAPKLPLIGKMPFLKKKQQSSVPKRKESSKETKQDILSSSNLVQDPKLEIPLTEEQKIDLSDNIAWVMNQENENLIENVPDPKTTAESEYPVVSDMDVCPPTSDYIGYDDQSGEVTNQDEEEYSCLDDLNTSECMDIEDDEPTECAAAATLKALDLLSIPLPGFKSANKTPLPSDIPLPPKTDEASKNQDNCDLPLPPGEESYPVTHFEMDNDSQEMLSAATVIQDVHRDCGSGSNSQDSFHIVGLVSNQGGSDITVPPGTENIVCSDLQVPLLTAEVGSDLPLPPGTESMMGPSLPLPPGTENLISPDVPLPPGTEHVMDPGLPLPPGTEDVGVTCLPFPPGAEDPVSSDLPLPPGTEEVAITSLPLPPGTEDITSDLPLPPGTEDETHMLVSSGLGVPNTQSKTLHLQDIAQKSKLGSDMTIPGTHFGAQELSSGAWSSGSNSQDGFGMAGFMTGMHENPIPPPPGTEDEHDLHAAMNVLPPMGIRDNIAGQYAPEKALTASQTTTVCMSSYTAPKLGLHTQNQLWNTSSNPEGIEHSGATWPTDPNAVMDMPTVTRKSHIDREFTPPPPGTEMDDLNKSDSHPELGEASMELSDESDEECLQDKKESTPPPPGTESSSESMAISESKSGKSIISTLEMSTRLDTKVRDPSLIVDFNAQSLDTQGSLPQSKKEESIKSIENTADSHNLSNVSVSKIGRRSSSTEDKEREEKKVSEKIKAKKTKEKVDERMQSEDSMSKEQGDVAGVPQQSQKAPRIGKPSKKESEEVEHTKEGKQESESKSKHRKTSKRLRDSTEEPQDLHPVEEESELPGSSEVKSSTPKKSSRTGKMEKYEEEEMEQESKINEESSTKHRKASKKTKERRESVDDQKLATDTDASASQEETQAMKKSSRTGRSTKKDKDENDQDVPVKETKQRKRSTRSSSDDQPSEKGSSTPRRKSRSVRATIPEEKEEDLENVLSPLETNENAEESEKANSSDVEDEQETDSDTVPQQRTRAVRRLVSEDQTYEAASPRKRSRKSKPSVSEEEEPPPRRSTRTTRASVTE
ncbi:serine/arginine repetitive matrix protein 2 isoform X4 [Penaeus vannamei]